MPSLLLDSSSASLPRPCPPSKQGTHTSGPPHPSAPCSRLAPAPRRIHHPPSPLSGAPLDPIERLNGGLCVGRADEAAKGICFRFTYLWGRGQRRVSWGGLGLANLRGGSGIGVFMGRADEMAKGIRLRRAWGRRGANKLKCCCCSFCCSVSASAYLVCEARCAVVAVVKRVSMSLVCVHASPGPQCKCERVVVAMTAAACVCAVLLLHYACVLPDLRCTS